MELTIANALAKTRLDYAEKQRFVRERIDQGERWRENSVLILLERAPAGSGTPYAFVLNKRSAYVSQPGDLCFPGGHPEPGPDRLFAKYVIPRIPAMRDNPAYRMLSARYPGQMPCIRYYLAGALRECHEEVRVNPWRIAFLGALPAYRMDTRRRMIYPMVGMVRSGTKIRVNPEEVEKNLRLYVDDLFDPDNYGTCTFALTGEYRGRYPVDEFDMPCYMVREPDGPDELLWGATFRMILHFANLAFGFQPPADGPVRVKRELYPNRATRQAAG
ncbi:MAG: NUDIX hydrolase [Desulfatibacillaceae bacterium]